MLLFIFNDKHNFNIYLRLPQRNRKKETKIWIYMHLLKVDEFKTVDKLTLKVSDNLKLHELHR